MDKIVLSFKSLSALFLREAEPSSIIPGWMDQADQVDLFCNYSESTWSYIERIKNWKMSSPHTYKAIVFGFAVQRDLAGVEQMYLCLSFLPTMRIVVPQSAQNRRQNLHRGQSCGRTALCDRETH